MAKKNDNSTIKYNMKQINQLASNIQKGMDDIYSSTYFNTRQNSDDLDAIKRDIDDSISTIISKNNDAIGTPSVTYLYTRLQNDKKSKNKESLDDLQKLFGDDQEIIGFLGVMADQKDIRDLDAEIDNVIHYVPRLQESLDLKKENVLTSDTFGSDFLNARNLSQTGEEKEAEFVERLKYLKKSYDLVEDMETWYDNTSKYGEEFIYISPYGKEFAKLLNSPNRLPNDSSDTMTISMKESGEISVTVKGQSETDEILEHSSGIFGNINITFNKGPIRSVYTSLNEASEIKKKSFDKSIKDDLNIEGFDDFKEYDTTSNDGLVDEKEIKETDIKINGCIVKTLDRDRVIPIYVENICLGYYYFEITTTSDNFGFTSKINPFAITNPGNQTTQITNNGEEMDKVIHYITDKLVKHIDAKFIENNPDIKKEIYMIMKHNDLFNSNKSSNINITFIPPEFIHHMYFKLDKKTHRGISDLDKALLPAKLYASIYLTNTIGVLTRGQDKRVYYVKQTVDTNIAASLLNAINQIKKSNFGLRELNSIGQVLNITGRYNDYFIPTNQGDSPIQFEVMQGQNIDIKTDLLGILEEMFTNAMDTPLELLQARESMDYATQYVMSNSKFYRKCIKRQSIVNTHFSEILSLIYNYEYEANDIIEVTLPIPIYLKMNSISTILDNANTYSDAIANYEYPDSSQDTQKLEFKRLLMRHQLQAHVDQQLIEQLKKEAEYNTSFIGNGEDEG